MPIHAATPAFTFDENLAMERAAARAWPALNTVDVDGWVWRCSGGGTRRANSVLPLAFSGRSVDASIDAVEARYRARKLRCYFQVSSISQPASLDDDLQRRGYTYEEPVLLLAKRLPPTHPTAFPPSVVVTQVPTEDWLAVYGATIDAVRRAATPATLARVPDERAFLLARRDGRPTASALGVVSPDHVAIVECVATDARHRRTGAARDVMAALEAWAASRGATTVALQVVETNAPARALYEGGGYQLAGRYHYRWRDV